MKKYILIGLMVCASVLAACTKNKEIELSADKYKGIEVSYEKVPDPDDAAVDAEIDALVKDAVTYSEDRVSTVKDGDTVNISFKEYVEGDETPVGSEDDYMYKVGSGSFHDGIDEELTGAAPGNAIDIPIMYAEDYPNKELAGKRGRIQIVIKYIVNDETPELTDQLVREYFNCADIEDFRKQVRNYLQAGIDAQNEEAAVTAAWNKVMKNAGTSDDAAVVAVIASNEGIDSSNADEAELQKYAIKHGIENIDNYKKEYSEEEIADDILFNRVLDFVMKNAIVTPIE